ncbi:MAG: AAA family ATPase [Pleurocapsa sp. SU_196_0]|nr:AAA family ATPase [Pleurocapsa sp. SU_196_0]
MNPIFVISGTPGSGKSSVSRALMERFAFGVHVPVDDLREFVVSGIAHPVPTWTQETTRQFRLARGNAVRMARFYAESGFASAIDDVISAESFAADYAPCFEGVFAHRVLLRPRLEVALERNASRDTKPFETGVLEDVIRFLHADLSVMERHGWHVVDSSDLTLEETVSAVLERTGVRP